MKWSSDSTNKNRDFSGVRAGSLAPPLDPQIQLNGTYQGTFPKPELVVKTNKHSQNISLKDVDSAIKLLEIMEH